MEAAWFVRARALHWLQRYDDALLDLREAEARAGATPELLRFRIDTLRRLAGPRATQELLSDLQTLLQIEPGTYTRCLVAEQLLDLAANAAEPDRDDILDLAAVALSLVTATDARTAVSKARLLELRGDLPAAAAAMSDASANFHGDPMVHYHAAQMFRRLGRDDASRAEARLARSLDPLSWPESVDPASQPAPAPQRLDVQEIGGFLQNVDSLMKALEPPPQQK